MNTAGTIFHYYQTILNRVPTEAEVAGWTDLVDNAGVPLDQVQDSFVNSYEALSNVAPIIEIYQANLGRVPDQAGLAYWVGVLDSGAMTVEQIGLTIASSAESQTYYGTDYDADFIISLYNRVLGRDPEPGAVDGWLGQRGNMSQAQVQEAFRSSAEAGALAAPAVTTFLLSIARQDPDPYTGSLFSIGRTYTLTTGHDYGATFTGTPGNDTFQGVEDTTGGPPIPTWTTGDAIDGGLGFNIFNVVQTDSIDGTPLGATVIGIQQANIVDAADVTLDTTDWGGLTELNVTDAGTTDLTAADTTDTMVTDSAGTVTITGGASQTVSTSAGDVTLSGSTGDIVVTDDALGANAIVVDGGASVTVTATGETDPSGNVVTIGDTTAPTGAVTVDVSSDPTVNTNVALGAIAITGGSVVDVKETVLGQANHTFTAGAINVQGTADTTSVSTSETAAANPSGDVTGVADNAVAITDVNSGSDTLAGTITSVAARNYTVLSIADTALTTLSLAGGSGNIIIDDSGLTTPTNTTLDVKVDGLTGGTLDDADIYTTMNITTARHDAVLANITDSALTTLTVAGTRKLTLVSTAGLSALITVIVSGAAGLTADLSSATVTMVDTHDSTGASTVRIDGTKAIFDGGRGVDNVTLVTGATKAISLGGGNDTLVVGALVPTATISGGAGTDTLSMDATSAATASGSGAFAGLVTGFEDLTLTGSTNQTIDLAVLGITDGVKTHGGNGLTLSNLANGSTLTLDGAGTAYTIGNSAFSAGANDTINLVLTDASSAGVAFASTGITMSNVENVDITTVDGQNTPTGSFNDSVTLFGNSSKTITIDGNAGLTLTATSTRLTSIDASGIVLGGFTYTAGALASAAAISGSATGTNTVDFSAATAAVTYTGGSGDDNISVTNSKANDISLGDGDNSVSGNSNGNNTITGGSGSDTITVGNGNNTISTGDGTDVVTTGSGTNTITTGTGPDTLTLGSGSNTVTLGEHSGADSISVAATTTGNFIPAATITGLNTVGLDTITFAGDAATAFTSYTTDQLNAFAVASGNGPVPLTLALAVADVLGSLGGNIAQHSIAAFQFDGSTYLVDQHGARGSAFAAGDTLVELTGTPTFNTTSVSAGVLHLLT